MREGLCTGEAYRWSNTAVEEKVGLSAGRPIRGGGGLGARRRRNTVCLNPAFKPGKS